MEICLLRIWAHPFPGCRNVDGPRCQEQFLRQTTLIRPEYAERFHCIGPACEDSCCEGWRVHIDRQTYERYQAIPAGPLRTLIDANILRQPHAEGVSNPSQEPFALVKMESNGHCPMLSADHLCQIQLAHGEGYLSKTCATYPRGPQVIDQLKEATLSLSCPEAARLVLLDPQLLRTTGGGFYHMSWDDAGKGESNMRHYFWPIRDFVVALVRNRAYPMWQRLFLLGTFCRRLDVVAREGNDLGFPFFFRDFSKAIVSGSLRRSMEAIPADLDLQLDLLLRLLKMRVETMEMAPRLRETLKDFTVGIGLTAECSRSSNTALYAEAHQRHFAPFFQKNPHILENYLVNTLFRELFPFGPKLFDPSATVEAAQAFGLLATKFALVKGLLIGVAGCHKESFCSEHVVKTVQAVFKHFEHNQGFLDQSHQLLVARNLDNAHGLTLLLRN
jgi:lysine-N-methylase